MQRTTTQPAERYWSILGGDLSVMLTCSTAFAAVGTGATLVLLDEADDGAGPLDAPCRLWAATSSLRAAACGGGRGGMHALHRAAPDSFPHCVLEYLWSRVSCAFVCQHGDGCEHRATCKAAMIKVQLKEDDERD